MVNIDLKTNDYQKSAYESKTDVTLIILTLICLLVVGFAVGIYFWEKSLADNAKAIKADIEVEQKKLSRQDTKDIMDFQKRLQVASGVVDNENMMQVSFQEIENLVISDVYIKSASYEKNELLIEIIAKDFSSLAKQIASFRQSEIFSKDISVAEAVVNEDGKVETRLTLKAN